MGEYPAPTGYACPGPWRPNGRVRQSPGLRTCARSGSAPAAGTPEYRRTRGGALMSGALAPQRQGLPRPGNSGRPVWARAGGHTAGIRGSPLLCLPETNFPTPPSYSRRDHQLVPTMCYSCHACGVEKISQWDGQRETCIGRSTYKRAELRDTVLSVREPAW